MASPLRAVVKLKKSSPSATLLAHYMSTAANVLLQQDTYLPKYGLVEPNMVAPAITEHIQTLESAFAELESKAERNHKLDWTGLVEELERIRHPLDTAWGAVNHLIGVKSSTELREEHKRLQVKVVELMKRMDQSRPINNAFQRLAKRGDLDVPQRRVIEMALLKAKQSGVELESEEQKKYRKEAGELSLLSSRFADNVLDATKAYTHLVTDPEHVKGIPQDVLSLAATKAQQTNSVAASAEKGPWMLTLDQACYLPVMQFCAHRPTRETLYRAHITRASRLQHPLSTHNNEEILTDILRLRHSQAQQLGYCDFAAQSLASKMAKNVDAVTSLIGQLRERCYPAAMREMEVLNRYAAERGHTGGLMQWDVTYWAEQQKRELYGIDSEALREYFSLPNVLKGMFGLAEKLFGVVIKETDIPSGVAWNSDVKLFSVSEKSTGETLASFFLDPYSRPQEKQGGAWMDICVQRSTVVTPPGQSVRLPVAHLICNQMPPVEGKPSLMTFTDVQTIFHEFGHGLQHMLTTANHSDVAGVTGIEWDAVEVPSQFMENWCYDRDTLLGMARHIDTAQPLTEEMYSKLKGAKTYMAGTAMLRQLLFSATDMALHTQENAGKDPISTYRTSAQAYAPLPLLPTDMSLCSFSHIFAGGYAAGYYSYKWAEVMAQDAFAAFEESDSTHYQELGQKFRKTILSMGGSYPPAEVFSKFRGRQPIVEPLLRTYGMA